MFSSKVMAVLALLAAACFIGLLTLQYMEFSFFATTPSVWPGQP